MSDIKVIKLSNYVRPVIEENKYSKWVFNGFQRGVRNSFYQYVIDRRNGSPTNAAILNAYDRLVYGSGLLYDGKSENKQIQEILKPSTVRKVITDFNTFSEAKLEVLKNRGKGLYEIGHLPCQNVIPSPADDRNIINSYWYSNNWQKYLQADYRPEEISSFGNNQPKEVYHIKPYSIGKQYFPDPWNISTLQYCEMEEEISNLNINSIKNGLSAGYIINVPNGKSWDKEVKDSFKSNIENKLTGSENASDFIIAFNSDETPSTVESFPVNENIHKQWEFLTKESRQQIITGHGLTSPVLAAINTASGFSSTADEMITAEAQLMRMVIKPRQEYLINAFEDILKENGINVKLEFDALSLDNKEIEKEEKKNNNNIKLSFNDNPKPTERLASALIEYGENLDSEKWDLLGYSDVDYKTDEDVYELINFASTGTARPNAKSSQDNEDILIRYRYVGSKAPQRDFCQKMIAANKLYRKEDIIKMGEKTVNEGFGMSPTPDKPYSIWLWKGGGKISEEHPNGTCRHKWQREIYLRKGGKLDLNSPLAKTISTSEARRRGYDVPVNESDVSLEPNKNKR